MKKFVTDNLAIVAAIVLPLILVALLAVSSLVMNRVVADPQYDFLLATNFYGGSNEAFYFDVVQNRLKISYAFPVQVNGDLPERQPLAAVARAGPRDGRRGDCPGAAAARRRHHRRPAGPHRDSRRQRPAGPEHAAGARWLRVPAVVRLLQRQHHAGAVRHAAAAVDRSAPSSRTVGPCPSATWAARPTAYNARFIGWVAENQ